MKQIIITIPDDCEVQIIKQFEENKKDKEDKEDKKIRTYQDLINNNIRINGNWINYCSEIQNCNITADTSHKNIASSEKVAKSMLAMAMISQLIPYYGGAVTDKEWKDTTTNKYTIERDCSESNQIKYNTHQFCYYFLAFHTKEQRDEFLRYNEQLVKDYLMID